MKKQVSSREKQLIINKISSLLQKYREISFAYIFGSFVSARNFSDVDIGIYLSEPDSLDQLSFAFKLEDEIQAEVHFPSDVRIINHAPPSFVYNMTREAIVIVDNDISRRSDFEGIIFKKYWDFAPFRKQYLKEVTNAPV